MGVQCELCISRCTVVAKVRGQVGQAYGPEDGRQSWYHSPKGLENIPLQSGQYSEWALEGAEGVCAVGMRFSTDG